MTRELSLADAVKELETKKKGGTNAIPCLAEFKRALKGEALDTCDVCQSVKRSPLVLKCQHSFCTQCVRALTQQQGNALKCAVCKEQSQPHECYKLLMPKEQARRDAPIAMDADDGELTRTRKVRRRVIQDKFKELIEALYGGKSEIFTKTEVTYEDGSTGSISATLRIDDAAVVSDQESAA